MRNDLTNKLSVPGLRFFGSLNVASKISFIFLIFVILSAVFAPLLAPYDPLSTGAPYGAPDLGAIFTMDHAADKLHVFGTDAAGRDIWSRMLYGARYSLIIGLFATLLALAVASVLGAIAAVAPMWISETLMRVLDVIMSFPGIALAVAFVAVLGTSIPVLIATIAFLYMPQLTRIVRANILAQVNEDYVSAGKVMGAPMYHILAYHVARNVVAPILVFATVLVADAIVFEASLSFIQAGVQEPTPSWGNIISQGREGALSGRWWPSLFPGLAITTTVLALNILSEGLTDAMIAPKASVKVAETLEDAIEAGEVADHDVIHIERGDSTMPLADRLTQLAKVERLRTDRFVLTEEERNAPPLLEVRNLSISFPKIHGDVKVVDNVSFSIRPGETMALVGESGCGKSITAKAIMGLLGNVASMSGEALYNGRNLVGMRDKELNDLRGHEIALIHQDALSALNPSMKIGAQFAQLTKRGGTRTAHDLLELVGLEPQRVLASYAHELSGGQRQRVLIAMALTRDPRLLIADEPTTALDVTVEHQVIELLNELREKLGFAMLFVSHDLALVAEVSHSITVMYAGQMVEQAPTQELLTRPVHEYTQGLLGAVLSIEEGSDRLHQVKGVVPSPREFPKGDRFAPRSSRPELANDPLEYRTIAGTHHVYAAHAQDPVIEVTS